MPITYSKATQSDAAGFAHCQIESFLEDKFYQAGFGLGPSSKPEDYQEQYDYRVERWKLRLQNTNIRWIKAMDDETGAVVGISGWELPEDRRSKNSIPGEEVKWPLSWNKEFLGLAEKRTDEILKANAIDSDRLWYVAMMAVLPSHRGRGIAQQLMERGVNFADEVGEGMYLESTPVARNTYERNGFEAVGVFEMPEGYLSDVMVRKARS